MLDQIEHGQLGAVVSTLIDHFYLVNIGIVRRLADVVQFSFFGEVAADAVGPGDAARAGADDLVDGEAKGAQNIGLVATAGYAVAQTGDQLAKFVTLKDSGIV